MKKLTLLSATLALALSSTFGHASIGVDIDRNGALGGGKVNGVYALDWAPGNALSVADDGESIGAGGASVGQSFMTYAQSRLATFNDIDGDPVALTTAGAEWTFVAGFREVFSQVASTGFGTSKFDVDTTNETNFFEIWFDPTADSNNLTGKGFAGGGDAILILTGSYLPSNQGTFTADATLGFDADGNPILVPKIENLDQFVNQDYADYETLVGTGSTPLIIKVETFDPAFFLNAPSILDFSLVTTAEQKLAFEQTNPSSCFWDGSAYITGAGNGIAGGCGAEGDGGSIGSTNGLTGPNVMFQIDGSTAFNGTTVPEPGSLALLGLGLSAMGFVATRRRKAK